MVRLRPQDTSDPVTMPGLIEGLPDAVALRCLARVPIHLHPKLALVSRSWREAIHSTELFKARKEVNNTEELICVSACEYDNLWQLYDPAHDLWTTIPYLPSNIRYLARFGVVSVKGKLYILGGGSNAVDLMTGDQDGSFATNEVWSYDPISRKWVLCAPMAVPRAMFACCELDGKIVVAGGFTSCRKSISKAEVYDPEKDTWTSIPDLHQAHNSVCTGVVIEGKVHILHRGLSTVQVLEAGLTWTVREECSWHHGPMAVVRGKLHIMCHGQIYRQERGSSTIIASASEFRNKIGFAMIGVRDDIYVIGGVFGPDRHNCDVKATSDVYVLSLGNERLGWRKVASMTQCNGVVPGCASLRI